MELEINSEKEQRGATEFTSYSIIPKPQTPKHKAEVKKAYEQRLEDGLFRKSTCRWKPIRGDGRLAVVGQG